MMHQPPECRLEKCQAVLLHDIFNYLESLESIVAEISITVIGTYC